MVVGGGEGRLWTCGFLVGGGRDEGGCRRVGREEGREEEGEREGKGLEFGFLG